MDPKDSTGRVSISVPAYIINFKGEQLQCREKLTEMGFEIMKRKAPPKGESPRLNLLLPIGWSRADGPDDLIFFICDSNGTCKVKINEIKKVTEILT